MTLFITGISGLLGLNLALQVETRFRVAGCYNHHPVSLPGVESLRLDITATDAVIATLSRIRPDVIVHTAGLTNVDECEVLPTLAHRLNVDGARSVAKAAQALGSQLVYISTDHLFDGMRPWKTETDLPRPLNIYAKTKRLAEQVTLELCPNALILRTNFFGWGTPFKASFSDWILQALEQERELRTFRDVFFTPILINDLVEVMLELIQRGATGIYHVAGGERLSKHDFALRVAEVFGLPGDAIVPVSVDEASLKAKRPKDMSLSTAKVSQALGKAMPSVLDGLRRLKALRDEGWEKRLAYAMTGRNQRIGLLAR